MFRNGVEKVYQIEAIPHNEVSFVKTSETKQNLPYSFHLLNASVNAALMELNAFSDIDRFKVFADSMFRVLQNNNIQNLIIDLHNNGGGNSDIGDELFQYISQVPFLQFSKIVCRYSDLQKNLALKNFSVDYYDKPNGISIIDNSNSWIIPRPNPLRFKGNVYLLISHTTFSSASSFSWTFKKLGLCTVVGEESGGVSVCFGDIVIYTLPNSGLQANISFCRMYFYDAEEQNIHGTIPDTIIPQEKALDYVINILKNE